MASITKENIPSVGDMVEKVILSTNKKFIKIVFSSNKEIVVGFENTNPQPTTSKIKTECVLVPIKSQPKAQATGSLKNTPSDPDYKRKAAQVIARMTGQPLEEVMSQHGAPVQMESSTNMEELAEKAQAALERSANRASRLAEELSRESGGRLESSFGGKETISMGG